MLFRSVVRTIKLRRAHARTIALGETFGSGALVPIQRVEVVMPMSIAVAEVTTLEKMELMNMGVKLKIVLYVTASALGFLPSWYYTDSLVEIPHAVFSLWFER